MQYIGMDTHISNLDFAVVNDAGRLMKATSVATSVKNFMEFVRKVPPPRITSTWVTSRMAKVVISRPDINLLSSNRYGMQHRRLASVIALQRTSNAQLRRSPTLLPELPIAGTVRVGSIPNTTTRVSLI